MALSVSVRRPASLGAALFFGLLTPQMERRSRRLGAVFFGLATISLAVGVRVFVPEGANFPWEAVWGALAVLWTWGGRRYRSLALAAMALIAGWMATKHLGATATDWRPFGRAIWLALLAWGTDRWYAGAGREALRGLQRAASLALGLWLWGAFALGSGRLLGDAAGLLITGLALRWLFGRENLPSWQRWAGSVLAALVLLSGSQPFFGLLQEKSANEALPYLAPVFWTLPFPRRKREKGMSMYTNFPRSITPYSRGTSTASSI